MCCRIFYLKSAFFFCSSAVCGVGSASVVTPPFYPEPPPFVINRDSFFDARNCALLRSAACTSGVGLSPGLLRDFGGCWAVISFRCSYLIRFRKLNFWVPRGPSRILSSSNFNFYASSIFCYKPKARAVISLTSPAFKVDFLFTTFCMSVPLL